MKKVLYYVLILPVAIALVVSCNGNKKVDAKSLNGDWKIVSVNGTSITGDQKPFIEFDMSSNKVHGNGGCNIFNSTLTLSDNDISAITIAPAAATMMACPDMETEDKIFKALTNVASVKKADQENSYILVDKNGKDLMVLVEK